MQTLILIIVLLNLIWSLFATIKGALNTKRFSEEAFEKHHKSMEGVIKRRNSIGSKLQNINKKLDKVLLKKQQGNAQNAEVQNYSNSPLIQ